MIGYIKEVNGKTFVLPDYYHNGLALGNIFKDEDSYKNDYNAICYIPESSFEDMNQDSDGYYEVEQKHGYSHNDLLNLCYKNNDLCDALFEDLAWLSPEVYIDEWTDSNISAFYNFIKKENFVIWNAPSGVNTGTYIVVNAPFEFDERDELINQDTFNLNSMVTITNHVEIFEVPVHELTKWEGN